MSRDKKSYCLYCEEDATTHKKRKLKYAVYYDLNVEPVVCLPVVIERKGVVTLYTILDGSDDPPVFNNGDSDILGV